LGRALGRSPWPLASLITIISGSHSVTPAKYDLRCRDGHSIARQVCASVVVPGGGRARGPSKAFITQCTWVLLHQRVAELLRLRLLLLCRRANGPRDADVAGQRRLVKAIYLQTRIRGAVGKLQGWRCAAVRGLRRRLAIEVAAENLRCVCPEDNDAGEVANCHNCIVVRDVRKSLRCTSASGSVERRRQDAPGRGLILWLVPLPFRR
jgi:hypothetical protein